jgi:hypothetical protein
MSSRFAISGKYVRPTPGFSRDALVPSHRLLRPYGIAPQSRNIRVRFSNGDRSNLENRRSAHLRAVLRNERRHRSGASARRHAKHGHDRNQAQRTSTGHRVHVCHCLIWCIAVLKPVSGVSSTRVATHSEIPIARKHFQLPSGSFLSTASAVPRTCFGSSPADATYEAVK